MITSYGCQCNGCKQVMQYFDLTGATRFKRFHESGCHAVVEIWNIRDKMYSDIPVVSDEIPQEK